MSGVHPLIVIPPLSLAVPLGHLVWPLSEAFCVILTGRAHSLLSNEVISVNGSEFAQCERVFENVEVV